MEEQSQEESKCIFKKYMDKLESVFSLRNFLKGSETFLPLLFVVALAVVIVFSITMFRLSFWFGLMTLLQGIIAVCVAFWLAYVLIDIRENTKKAKRKIIYPQVAVGRSHLNDLLLYMLQHHLKL